MSMYSQSGLVDVGHKNDVLPTTVNTRFMEIQMDSANDFGVNLFEQGFGQGSQLEYNLLVNNPNYVEVVHEGFDNFFPSVLQIR
jgi:hypothetical protein